MMLQPRRVIAHERGNAFATLAARDVEAFAELLEHQLVVVAAAIQPERQHDRHFQRRRERPRPGRECRIRPEERHAHRRIARLGAIDQQRDEFSAR